MSNLEIVGLALWWAEGSKSRRDIRWKSAVSYPIEITNTDDRVICLFMKYLIEELQVSRDKFKLQLQIHSGDDREALESYWAKITGIQRENFQKTIIRPIGNKPGKSKGTCKVRFSDKMLYNTLQQKLDNLLYELSGIGAVG